MTPAQQMLETARLRLRPFAPGDASRVRRLAGERAVADTTLRIPHPYPEGAAEAWISTHAPRFAEGVAVTYAVTLRDAGELIGTVGLEIDPQHRRAELGYWIGTPFWGRGYATEAAETLLRFAFVELELHRVFAHHLTRNPASGAVLRKIGMTHEGCLRQHVRKWDRFEDVEQYGILREEWDGGGREGLGDRR